MRCIVRWHKTHKVNKMLDDWWLGADVYLGLYVHALGAWKISHWHCSAVVKIDCSKRLAFLLQDLKLTSSEQQLISKTDTNAQTI